MKETGGEEATTVNDGVIGLYETHQSFPVSFSKVTYSISSLTPLDIVKDWITLIC